MPNVEETNPDFYRHVSLKNKIAVLYYLVFFTCLSASAQNRWDSFDYRRKENSHDVTVPDWGPYTKNYMGISHIADKEKGLRFDLSVMPGFYRQKVVVPNVLYESGYYPWNASADLNYFSFREELEWKDKVYADVAFAPFDSISRLVQITCTNNSTANQNLVVHLLESIHYPEINPTQILLPSGITWKPAIDYKTLSYAKPRPQDNLTYDGWKKGEVRGSEFIGGSALSKGFGKDDKISYDVVIEKDIADAFLLIRYRAPKGSTSTYTATGFYTSQISFIGSGKMKELRLPLGSVKKGTHQFNLSSEGNSELELDGFAVLKSVSDSLQYRTDFNPVPEIISNPRNNNLLLKYKYLPQYYGLTWSFDNAEVREFFTDAVDISLPLAVNNHGDKQFYINDKGHYTDLFLRPIPLKPGETKIIYAVVSSGSKEAVEEVLKKFQQQKDYSRYFIKYTSNTVQTAYNPSGKKYLFGEQIIRTNTLQNVVFPVYTSRSYIKHFTPGRWWNSLYTWDAGFIGLGMSEIDAHKAIEILNAYTTGDDDTNAFVHHGSMVPVQAFLFQQLYNKTHSKELLAYFYPRLKKYYLFYAGKSGSSTMLMKESNLLRAWDYFYNSGGWDDYSPQKFIRGKKEYTDHITPVVTTAMAIRFAKILSTAAVLLDLTEDQKVYNADIKSFTEALQKYSWDEASGYFGYVVHDSAGKALGLLKTSAGENFNKGMDGAYPLMAGITTKPQQNILLRNLFSPKKLWSPVGLTAVDQSASYYSNEGYWNGTVWFPHQWFFWKTMLDIGEGDKAFQIAKTALEIWKKETELTYHSAEHFSIETGRGAGWHQFSALSTPILSWTAAYFHPGSITTGFDTWITASSFNKEATNMRASFYCSATRPSTIIICMKEGRKYRVKASGKPVSYKEIVGGALQITLPATANKTIEIEINHL